MCLSWSASVPFKQIFKTAHKHTFFWVGGGRAGESRTLLLGADQSFPSVLNFLSCRTLPSLELEIVFKCYSAYTTFFHGSALNYKDLKRVVVRPLFSIHHFLFRSHSFENPDSSHELQPPNGEILPRLALIRTLLQALPCISVKQFAE